MDATWLDYKKLILAMPSGQWTVLKKAVDYYTISHLN